MRKVEFEKVGPLAYNELWSDFIGVAENDIFYVLKALQNFFHDEAPRRIYMFLLFSHGPLIAQLKCHEQNLRKAASYYLKDPLLWDWLKVIKLPASKIDSKLSLFSGMTEKQKQYWRAAKAWNHVISAFVKKPIPTSRRREDRWEQVDIKKHLLEARIPLTPKEVVCVEQYFRGYAAISNKLWKLTPKKAQQYYGAMRLALEKNSDEFLRQLEIAIGLPRPVSEIEMFLGFQINSDLFYPFQGPYCDLKNHELIKLNVDQFKKLTKNSNRDFFVSFYNKLYENRKAIETKRKRLKNKSETLPVDKSRVQL